MASFDREEMSRAYDSVRDDSDPCNWAVFKYQDTSIHCAASGTEFDELKSHLNDDERAFVYLRVETGDEMSKRKKFVLLTWIGANVSVLQRAKAGTDKSNIKQIIQNFAIEIQTNELGEVDEQGIVAEVRRAGGANYGTGGL